MSDCIFCKIASGEIPGKIVFETDEIIAFHDVNPVAPVHVLVIPKDHYSDLHDLISKDIKLSEKLFIAIDQVAIDFEIQEKGFRIIMNNGEEGGQTVPHLHFHIIGGTKLSNRLV